MSNGAGSTIAAGCLAVVLWAGLWAGLIAAATWIVKLVMGG